MSRAWHGRVNVTGFAAQEYAVSGKSMELLKEIVPHLTRVAVLRDSAIAAGPGQFGALQAVAPSFGVELRPLDLQDPGGRYQIPPSGGQKHVSTFE